MSSAPLLEAGNLLGAALLDPRLSAKAKRHVHDAMNELTKAVIDIEMAPLTDQRIPL